MSRNERARWAQAMADDDVRAKVAQLIEVLETERVSARPGSPLVEVITQQLQATIVRRAGVESAPPAAVEEGPRE